MSQYTATLKWSTSLKTDPLKSLTCTINGFHLIALRLCPRGKRDISNLTGRNVIREKGGKKSASLEQCRREKPDKLSPRGRKDISNTRKANCLLSRLERLRPKPRDPRRNTSLTNAKPPLSGTETTTGVIQAATTGVIQAATTGVIQAATTGVAGVLVKVITDGGVLVRVITDGVRVITDGGVLVGVIIIT